LFGRLFSVRTEPGAERGTEPIPFSFERFDRWIVVGMSVLPASHITPRLPTLKSHLRIRPGIESILGETKEDEMKTERIFIIGLSLVVMALPALAVAVPNYIVCCQQAEKWFHSEGSLQSPEMRIHTVINGSFNGAVIQEKNIWIENQLVEAKRLLFRKDDEGKIYYHGDLNGNVLEDPILWVDTPLVIGKTWRGATPGHPSGISPDGLTHYVFAVLEKGEISCPAGTFTAHVVSLSMIYPDGQIENQLFWYNNHCGLVMCTMSEKNCQRVFTLRKAFLPEMGELPDIHCDDASEKAGFTGLTGLQARPNPLNPMTTISFTLGARSRVNLRVFDVSGRLVRTLVGGEFMNPGECSVQWNGKDDRGIPVASGIYHYLLQAGVDQRSNSLTLVR
jgi:hypothetical protein